MWLGASAGEDTRRRLVRFAGLGAFDTLRQRIALCRTPCGAGIPRESGGPLTGQNERLAGEGLWRLAVPRGGTSGVSGGRGRRGLCVAGLALSAGFAGAKRGNGRHAKAKNNGGEAGIRTLVTQKRKTAFEAAAFNHSATSPLDDVMDSVQRDCAGRPPRAFGRAGCGTVSHRACAPSWKGLLLVHRHGHADLIRCFLRLATLGNSVTRRRCVTVVAAGEFSPALRRAKGLTSRAAPPATATRVPPVRRCRSAGCRRRLPFP